MTIQHNIHPQEKHVLAYTKNTRHYYRNVFFFVSLVWPSGESGHWSSLLPPSQHRPTYAAEICLCAHFFAICDMKRYSSLKIGTIKKMNE